MPDLPGRRVGARRGPVTDPSGVARRYAEFRQYFDADELVRKMEANVHLMSNPSEACPAKWVPGAKTLKPGKDIVGNVASVLGK